MNIKYDLEIWVQDIHDVIVYPWTAYYRIYDFLPVPENGDFRFLRLRREGGRERESPKEDIFTQFSSRRSLIVLVLILIYLLYIAYSEIRR